MLTLRLALEEVVVLDSDIDAIEVPPMCRIDRDF